MTAKRSSQPAPSSAIDFQALEPRRLFSFVFFVSFGDDGIFSFSSQPLPLPSSASSLSHENLALPAPSLFLPSPTTPAPKTDFNIKGFYAGTGAIPGLGSTPLALTITRQRRGSISGTLTIPAFSRSVSGTVPVTFSGGRRFSATLIQNGDSASLTARLNRDNSLTGEFSATIGGLHFAGAFSLARLSA